MERSRLEILLKKHHRRECSPEELEELYDWYEQYGDDAPMKLPDFVTQNRERYFEAKFEEFNVLKGNRKAFVPLLRLAVAAMLIIGIGITGYWIIRQSATTQPTKMISDIPPGHNGAVLTLADGKKIILDSTGNGAIAQQGSVQVMNATGQLSYINGKNISSAVVYNTLTTPRGRQYRLILPDGTKVWLNAASSIRFPTAFTGKERSVIVTGEAYFEVVHNALQPFEVVANNITIKDVGTYFDVSAYSDEPLIKATLLEGAIKVNSKLLKPGQQAQVNKDAHVKVVQLPDAGNAIAWTNGQIVFSSEDFPTLLRQISRWYNIEVVIKGNIPPLHMTGEMSRNMDLSNVLKVLELYGLKFEYTGKKLIVSAK